MPHVLWIGGAPGSGKTTVALRLARRYGLRLYSADTRTWAHRDRALAAGNAAARRWEAAIAGAALAARVARRAAGDVAACRARRDGGRRSTRAARALQRARLACRAAAEPQARLYLLLCELIAREASEHAVPTLPVDGSAGIAATTEAVERLFAGALADGPPAAGRGERRALLRESERGDRGAGARYHARPWARGDAEGVMREFACECGDPACTAGVPLPVGALGDRPVLARDHGQDRDGAPRKSP